MADRELMGPGEVQAFLGVSRPTLATYRRRPEFPKPIAELSIGPVWDGAAVREWQESRSRDARAPRDRAVQVFRRTGSVTETARELEVGRDTITSWLREAGEPLPRAA